MARRIILSDDVTGIEDESVKTYSFMLEDGKYYQIDLSRESFAKLTKVLKPFKDHMREVSRIVATIGPNGSEAAKDQTASIRVWARQNGHEVGDRGRMPEEVINAYNTAHATTSAE